MAVGDLVTASRFNLLQNRIAGILGFGAGSNGYGQGLSGYGGGVSSTEVSNNDNTLNNTITAENANDLYIDLLRARIHQIGIANSEISQIVSNLLTVDRDALLKKDLNIAAENTSDFVDDQGNQTLDPLGDTKGFADFEALMNRVEQDKFLLHSSQGQYEQGTQSSRTSNWNTAVDHEVRVTFRNADHRRHFFNAGGEIRFQASLDNPQNSKSDDWSGLLYTSGIAIFNHTQTKRKETNNAIYAGVYSSVTDPEEYGVGNSDLTSSYRLVYRKNSNSINSAGIYSSNMYEIYAREINSAEIQFRILLSDSSRDPAIDNLVVGNLTSRVGHFRAKGNFTGDNDAFLNVEVPPPVYSNISEL